LSVVQGIINDVVSKYLENHRRLRWPEPELFYKCSDVCYDIRKLARRHRIRIEFKIKEGFWRGPVSSEFTNAAVDRGWMKQHGDAVGHTWLCITYFNETLFVDPTCVQFDSSAWSWDSCVTAAAN
jgi:hypothetical protein